MAKLKMKRTILNDCITACVNESKQKAERFKIEKFCKISDHIDQLKVTEKICNLQRIDYENVSIDEVNMNMNENKTFNKQLETVA